MSRYSVCYFLGMMLAVPSVYAAKVRLEVKGLSGDLEKNVRVNLSTIADDEVGEDGRFKARVDAAIRQGLRALGYYEPTIHFELQPKPAPSRPVLLVTVKQGEPVKVAGVDVTITGEAEKDADYQSVLKTKTAKVGDILNHGKYESFKSSLTGLSWRKGFFDADMTKSQLGVSVERREGFWDIDFDSGRRYRFGDVSFSGSQIREDYLQNLVPFKNGDYYSSEDLAELNRRLAETGWFNSVIVTPKFEGVGEDKILPLEGVMTPRTKNTLELGGGYSTDVGPRVKGSWKKPWLNSRGHSLDSTLSLSAPEQTLDFNYKMPLRKSPLEQYYLLQGGFKREDLNDTKSDSVTLNIARYWNSSSGWQRAINLRWSYDDFTQADYSTKTMLLYPGVSISRTRQRGGLMPTWGDSQRYSADVSNEMWGSDVDFAVLQAQNTWIRTLADKHRFVVRGTVGWIETSDFKRVPPSLRFFAGGDRSIRGYKYKDISPEDETGQLTGASKMLTGSLEYQYNVMDQWWGAVFVDSGEAVNDIRDNDFKTGAGIGVRWASPVGPVKFDLAAPIGDKDKSGIQFYIGLGPEL